MARIQKLSNETISKIAAGEVVQKPSSALKELMENSIDAGSTSIVVKLKDGGMTLIQIIDNGLGIHVEDLPILCHRYTTSKIKAYEDLSRLTTFGFRGEALSSISQVAKLTVCSRRQGETLGYKAEYVCGELLNPPCVYAYDKGTCITIEDLFYTNPCRKRALSDCSELFRNCWDLIAKYSLHYPHISFKLFKGDCIELKTSGDGNQDEPLKALLKGCSISREIIEIPSTKTDFCEYSGMVSNSQYSLKLKLFVIFVNGRLVDSNDLKKLINEIYGKFMPKSSSFFVYISIKVPSNEVDVNVHPTKLEVRFSKENHIFAEITTRIQDILSVSNDSRVLTIKSFELPKPGLDKLAPLRQVREQPTVPLEWFVEPKPMHIPKKNNEDLASVQELKEEIHQGKYQEVLSKFYYVGCANKDYVLIQYQTSLYLLSVSQVLQCYIYQDILNHFAQLPSFEIPNLSLSLSEIFDLALSSPHLGYNPSTDPPAVQLIDNYTKFLDQKAELLEEYFSLSIKDGVIRKIPVVCDGLVVPDINNLPEFLLRLCTDVNWKNEKKCLGKIAELLAWFYSKVPDTWAVGETTEDFEVHYKNLLFPYLRGRVIADSRKIDEGFIHIVSTEDLYKIFERC